MASGEMTSAKWVKFFTDSGLPSDVAVNYAIIFVDNRIQKGMLLDLTKEYLFDMGIHVMGDVIAILKHAKQVHSQEAQEKVMQSDKASPSYSAASRILSRYARRVEQRPSPPQSRDSFEDFSQKASTEASRPAKRGAGDDVDRRAKQQAVAQHRSVQKPERRTTVQRTLVHLPESRSAVRRHPFQAPESRPALQQQQTEGPTLKVILPAGNTPRSRQILDKAFGQAGTASVTKRSVFDRLGESAVSSTTDVAHPKQQQSSVFQRLGPSTDDSGGKESPDEGAPLPYRGVLKAASAARASANVIRLTKANTTAPTKTLTVRRSAVDPARRGVGDGPVARGTVSSWEAPGSLILRKSISEATSNGSRMARGSSLATSTRGTQSVRERLGAPVPRKPGVGPVGARLSSGLRADRVVLRNTQPRTRTVLCADERHTVFSRLGK